MKLLGNVANKVTTINTLTALNVDASDVASNRSTNGHLHLHGTQNGNNVTLVDMCTLLNTNINNQRYQACWSQPWFW